jgi:hypothetical protein
MDIKGHGSFIRIEYEGNRYIRLCEWDIFGYSWYKYDFFTDSMQLLTNEGVMQFELAKELEEAYQESIKPKDSKFDLSNEEMFPLMMDAIKNREPFDSNDHQPNSSKDRKFIVLIDEDNNAVLWVQPNVKIYTFGRSGGRHYKTPYRLAMFREDRIELHIPSLDMLPRTKGRPKLIRMMLKMISEHFNVPKYIYTEKFNGELLLFTIYKEELAYVAEKDSYFPKRGEVITTTTPLIFNLSIDT